MNKYLEQAKKIFKKMVVNKKKAIEIAVIIVIVGIIILITASAFEKPSENEVSIGSQDAKTNAKTNIKASTSTNSTNNSDNEMYGRMDKMQSDLQTILSNIKGIGNVKVMVTFETSVERIAATNSETQKKTQAETQSENSKTTESHSTEVSHKNEISFQENDQDDSGTQKQPIILKEIMPKVRGVLIVAQNINDSQLRTEILAAASAVTGVGQYKIKLLQGG